MRIFRAERRRKGDGKNMRIDKFLKNSRLIKRRTRAKEACEQERVWINGELKVRVLLLSEHTNKELAASMYEVIG